MGNQTINVGLVSIHSTFYVPERFLYAPYSFLLISNKFWMGGGDAILGPKKLKISRAQPSPTCPSNGSARIKNIMHRDVKIIGA
jgi:hypothetical protein